ncbi:hypothetical protein EYF80_012363 [Liparis tanakae]|uniref:Uncharacterized protein n=1 Tax=Liparis tanakae TaxID=230148 RepID=A0A4Z2IHA2_9TELE|nr:hypothetical protein EYF80_012363 [Liparis tanakae]
MDLFISHALFPTLHAAVVPLRVASGRGATPPTTENKPHKAGNEDEDEAGGVNEPEGEREQCRGTCGGRVRAALTTEDSEQQQLLSKVLFMEARLMANTMNTTGSRICESRPFLSLRLWWNLLIRMAAICCHARAMPCTMDEPVEGGSAAFQTSFLQEGDAVAQYFSLIQVMLRLEQGSTPVVGSSRTTKREPPMKAMEIDSLRFMPPDRAPTRLYLAETMKSNAHWEL